MLSSIHARLCANFLKRAPSFISYCNAYCISTAAHILYLDSNYCIVNKPANICIDGKDEFTMEKLTRAALLNHHEYEHSGKQLKIRHCHQLDKATSGILIYGLNKKSTTKINQIIQKRQMSKVYYCIVHGHIAGINHFILDFPIVDSHQTMIGTDKKEGVAAITECFVEKIGYFRTDTHENETAVSLLRVELHSGRKHQIRLHLSHIGHAVVGDPVYSRKPELFQRMYLDSHRSVFHVNHTKRIDVQTNSDREFGALVAAHDKTADVQFYNEVFMIDHTEFQHSMIVPYILSDDKHHIQILLKQKLDMDGSHCWSFMSECKLGDQYLDIPQNAASLVQLSPRFFDVYRHIIKLHSH